VNIKQVLGRLVQLRYEGVPEDAEVVIETVRGSETVAEVNATCRHDKKRLTVVVQSRELVDDLGRPRKVIR